MLPGDYPGIINIHRSCEDPWRDTVVGTAWLQNRAERGFYLQTALLGGYIVGHGEYLLSREPEGGFLYLGMLQIDDDFQRRGVGRAMMKDAADHARMAGVDRILTIPDYDTGSENFYAKCGFEPFDTIYSASLASERKGAKYNIAPVPESVTYELKFVLGHSQASSRHMWEVANRRPRTDCRLTPSIRTADGYVQLNYFDGDESAMALYWSGAPGAAGVDAALELAAECGLKRVDFFFPERYAYLFEGVEFRRECEVLMLAL